MSVSPIWSQESSSTSGCYEEVEKGLSLPEEQYSEVVERQFLQGWVKGPIRKLETYPRWMRIALEVLGIVTVIPTIVRIAHRTLGFLTIPATRRSKRECATFTEKMVTWLRGDGAREGWRARRLTLQVNGAMVDMTLLTKREFFDKKRWVFLADGNKSSPDYRLGRERHRKDILQMASERQAGIVLYHHHGSGKSGDWLFGASCKGLVNGSLAVLDTVFASKERGGLEAKKIFPIGYSMGGGVLSTVLTRLPAAMRRQLRVIYTMSYTSLAAAAEGSFRLHYPMRKKRWQKLQKAWDLTGRWLFGKFIYLLANLSCWNLKTAVCIRKTADVPALIINPGEGRELYGDGTISQEAALAKAFLDDCPSHCTVMLRKSAEGGVPRHCSWFSYRVREEQLSARMEGTDRAIYTHWTEARSPALAGAF